MDKKEQISEIPINTLYVCVLSCFSHIQLFVTPWIIVHQVPLSMGFSRQEYWSGLLFLSPGDIPKPGIEPGSLTLQADSLLSELTGKPNKYLSNDYYFKKYFIKNPDFVIPTVHLSWVLNWLILFPLEWQP